MRVVLNYAGIGQALRHPKVRNAIANRADQIAARARQIASSDNRDVTVRVEEGTRATGRSYARVLSDDAAGEFGTSRTQRRRTLGRAADIQE